MRFIKQLVDFYITSSIHVAFSVYALVQMSYFVFDVRNNSPMAHFAFFGTIVGYNFVKYDALARAKKNAMRKELKLIALLSFFSLVGVGYSFFQLERITQWVAVGVLVLTLLYTLPFFPNRKNARNWAGVKIYIVSLCWVGVTLVLPLINAHVDLGFDFYLKCVQRFILVFVLILIFEIIDLTNDDPHLQTVPQQIGVRRTKIVGLFLMLIPFYFLEFFKINFVEKQLFINLVLVLMVSLFLFFSNEKRSKYYTSFWVESIPILWWLMVAFL